MYQGVQSFSPNPLIREYGCFFLSLIELAQRWSVQRGASLTVNLDPNPFEAIEGVYARAIQRGCLQADCTVLSGAGLLGGLTGVKWSEVKRFDAPKWQTEKPSPPDVCKFYVKKLKKTGYTHFVLQWYDETFDPLPPDRPAAQFYRFAGYRAYLPIPAPSPAHTSPFLPLIKTLQLSDIRY
jgi:hypothetical protein